MVVIAIDNHRVGHFSLSYSSSLLSFLFTTTTKIFEVYFREFVETMRTRKRRISEFGKRFVEGEGCERCVSEFD